MPLVKAGKGSRSRKYQVPAVKRAFAILDALSASSFPLSVQEVSRIHKVPYSTAFYLLETMEQCGYVQRSDESKKYTVGHKLSVLRDGVAARNHLSLRALASPFLEELVQLTGLTVHLAVLQEDAAIYIEKRESPGYIRLNTWIGKRNSLHCTAVGKALLMHLSEIEIRRLCPLAKMHRRTDRTIISQDALIDDLAKGRQRGYVFDDGEDEKEGRCVAAPVFGSDGKVVAALGLSGTLAQIDLHRMNAFGKLVNHHAQQISARLGYLNEASPAPVLSEKPDSGSQN